VVDIGRADQGVIVIRGKGVDALCFFIKPKNLALNGNPASMLAWGDRPVQPDEW